MSTESPQPNGAKPSERFESDTQRIVRRHLENKDDKITEEDLRNVRIGLTPDAVDTKQKIEELTDDIKTDSNDVKPNDEPTTPWDTLQR